MLPLPERSKRSNIRNFKGQENFLLCWYGEGNPCIMWHTLGEPFTLWRATGTGGPVSVALTLTLVAAERRMPTSERAEESSPKWNVLYSPTPVQSHFMQTLKPYQGQRSFYWRYQHTLENQYCLQSYSWFFHKDLQISRSLPHSAVEDNSVGWEVEERPRICLVQDPYSHFYVFYPAILTVNTMNNFSAMIRFII